MGSQPETDTKRHNWFLLLVVASGLLSLGSWLHARYGASGIAPWDGEITPSNRLVALVRSSLTDFEAHDNIPVDTPTHSWRAILAKRLLGFREIDLSRPWPETEPALPPSNFCVKGTEAGVFMASSIGPMASSHAMLPKNLGLLLAFRGSGVHWMAPGSISLDHLRRGELAILTAKETITLPARELLIGFADGQVWRVGKETPLTLVAEICDPSTATEQGRNRLRPYREPTRKTEEQN